MTIYWDDCYDATCNGLCKKCTRQFFELKHNKHTCKQCYDTYMSEKFGRYHFKYVLNDNGIDFKRINKTLCDGDFRNESTDCVECLSFRQYVKSVGRTKLNKCRYNVYKDPDMKKYLEG
jgi:hypothetical protein